jgi:AsmA protein
MRAAFCRTPFHPDYKDSSMKALGKILGLVFLGLLLLLVVLGFALTHLFDPNDYKDEIRKIAHDKANLELTLNGDIGWSLFPWLGIELHEATLASAATPDKPFADLRMLGLSVRVLPLLRKQVQMSDIRVEGLDLTLERDAQGAGNWEQVGHPPPAAAPNSAETSTPAPSSDAAEQSAEAPAEPLKLDIDSLSVKDARVAYHDERNGQQFSAESIELSTGAIREGSDIPFKLSAFFGSNKPVMRARTELQADLRFDRALKRYQLGNARLSGEASGEPLQGKTLTFSAQGELLADLAAQIAEWNSLKLTANGLRAIGDLKVRDLESDPKLSGGLSVAEFNLREFLDGIGQQLPPMADAGALGKAELATRLNATQNSIALDDLTLKLDGGNFSGAIAVTDLTKRALQVQLKGDRLDLDRYLPPTSRDSQAASAARQSEVNDSVAAAGRGTSELPEKPSQQAWSDEPVLPLEQLRKLDARVDLSLGLLTLEKLPIANASLKVSGKGGLLAVDELRGDLHDGRFDAKGQFDARQPEAQLSLTSHIARVPVEKILQRNGEATPIQGLLDLNADLRSRGNSQKAWIEGLNGTASFTLNDGVLVDANLEQQLCMAIATLNRKSLSSEPRGRNTPFEQLQGSLTFRNGVASNPDLKARIPGLRVNGDGDLDLRVLGMDYRVGIVIEGDKSEMPDPACQVNQRYADIAWPLRCRGPLELGAKACRLDKDEMGKVAAQLAGDKLNQKIEEKLGDKVSPELKDALKGLFKR